MIALFDSKGDLSSSYKIIEANSSLERFDKPYEGSCLYVAKGTISL